MLLSKYAELQNLFKFVLSLLIDGELRNTKQRNDDGLQRLAQIVGVSSQTDNASTQYSAVHRSTLQYVT